MAEDLYKSVTVDNEEYSVMKFSAIEGMKIVRLILAKLAPIIPFLEGNTEEIDDRFVTAFAEAIGGLTDNELETLIKRCLKVCYKHMPAGLQPVVDATGHFGVEGIEHDMLKTISLCIEAISWGASDFFGEKGSALMAGIMGRVSSLLPR